MTYTPSGPEDPYKHLKISGIEEKKFIEEFEEKKEKLKKSKKDAFIFFLAKKLLSFLPRRSTQSAIKNMQEDLITLHMLLEKLTITDKSQDTEYLQKLSTCWKSFLHHFMPVAMKKHPLILAIREFFDMIHTYPNFHQFSLGYYLSSYAGKKWVPFPFMEMLHNLFIENEQDPEKSHLQQWLQKIEDILKN